MTATADEKQRMGARAQKLALDLGADGYQGIAFVYHNGSHAMAMKHNGETKDLVEVAKGAHLALQDFMRRVGITIEEGDYVYNVVTKAI